MCIAVPGEIGSIDNESGQDAKVDFHGNILHVNLGLVQAKVGDFVLVHAGCAIEVMKKDAAEELLSLFDELESVMYKES